MAVPHDGETLTIGSSRIEWRRGGINVISESGVTVRIRPEHVIPMVSAMVAWVARSRYLPARLARTK